MKTLLIIFFSLCCSFFCVAQVETPDLIANMDEVEVTPPLFTGVNNADLLESSNFFRDYLKRNFSYTTNKLSGEGVEVVSFVVTAAGQITDIEIVNSVSPKIDEMFTLLIEETNGMWRPALKDGQYAAMPQEVSFTISFSDNAEIMQERFKGKAENYFTKAGLAFFEKRNLKRAENLYNNAVRYMPHDCSTLLMRGLCRYGRGDKDGAKDDWLRVKAMGSIDNVETYFAEDIKEMDGYKELVTLLEK